MEKAQDTGPSSLAALGSPAAFATGSDAERWRKAQGLYLARWKGFSERWSRHRLQDLQSTIELAVRPWCSLDPKELVEMQQEWMAGIVDRYTLDAIAFVENAVLLSVGGIFHPTAVQSKSGTDVAALSQHRVKGRKSEIA